jgi:hypothetical protein
MLLDKSLQYHEVTLQEDLDAYRFEDSSFMFINEDVLEEEHIFLEDDTCQDNVVKT